MKKASSCWLLSFLAEHRCAGLVSLQRRKGHRIEMLRHITQRILQRFWGCGTQVDVAHFAARTFFFTVPMDVAMWIRQDRSWQLILAEDIDHRCRADQTRAAQW